MILKEITAPVAAVSFLFVGDILTLNENTKMEKVRYIAPDVEVLEIKIEQGFAVSPDFTVPDGGNNGEPIWG